MPSRLSRTFILACVLLAFHAPSTAQRYRAMPYGGAWHGGWHGPAGYYHGYAAPYGYGHLYYYGARYGYGGYYGGYYGYPWYAFGVGLVGALLAPVFYRPPPPPIYVYLPPPPAQPAIQHCPDGSTVAAGSYCPVAPAPAPAPAPLPAPTPERG